MSCQSLAARAFAEPDKDSMTHCGTFHRSVRFSSESRSSTRQADTECKRENSGSISLTALAVTPVTSQSSAMSQSAPSTGAYRHDTSPPSPAACRFPKLEECAHFHYERVSLGGLSIQCVRCDYTCTDVGDEGWISIKVRSHVNSSPEECDSRLQASWSEASDVSEWTLNRNREHLLKLDDMLHRCIYDRKVSGLPDLSEELKTQLEDTCYHRLIADYMHHLSIIADDSINCGSILNWLQMDNKGHKLLVSNEDSSSINTPAVAAAYSVRKYVSQARDEISFEVGDMISIIDMPGPQESVWWRGKRGFRVGFFPHHCVAVIGDKVPRHMTQPPPIVGSVAVAPIKPVLRKHGKVISLFRSFILSRPSRRSLKQQGILRERVFGCDLGEHLLNCQHQVPLVLRECAAAIESRGAVDGVYRLSGGSGLTQRLRAAFDGGAAPDLAAACIARDPHAVPSLLKTYFRELPNPLCTYQLYESFVSAVQQPDEMSKLKAVRDTVVKLPPPHYRTLAYLMRHLRRVSLLGAVTGMTARNMAIVWAPNLLRAPHTQHALQGVAVQAVVTEFLICYAEELFAEEQGADSAPSSLEQDRSECVVELRGSDSCRRPKSLPVNPPTKLLTLEEARRRGAPSVPPPPSPPAPTPSVQLRPATQPPKYIEVGNGPNNLPQYHTVLELPAACNKRGVKRAPAGWRGLFTRVKHAPPALDIQHCTTQQDVAMCEGLRPVKSCESLASDTDTLAPLADRAIVPLKQHTRSSSCDSYFEPWQAELADMRLRLAPQERDHHMFSEEDDTQAQPQNDSVCSTPPESGLCSVEPSPQRNLRVDIEAANQLAESRRAALEEQLSQLRYIDGESPRPRAPPEKRHSRPDTHADIPKRLCKDRESPKASQSDFQTSLSNVKLRERNSPRKTRNSTRYSGMHHPVDMDKNSRLSWHGKDGHSTLIKIDWPVENSSVSNLTTSTLNSSPITPITPVYDPLETDSEFSESNKHTIKIQSNDCLNCVEGKCLKCELRAADRVDARESLEPSPIHSDISYQNLNRLSAVSTSSSDHNSDKKHDLKVMTSSHESSSSYSNSRHDEMYESYNFNRPNYINLQSSSSKSSPGSPLKSPLKSTISITFRSPSKSKDSDRDSVYEDIDLEKNLSIVEDATVPQTDASLPTQEACQPENFDNDLIILETPTETNLDDDIDVYSQVKFFKKSIEEVNAMILESPDKEDTKSVILPTNSNDRHYENVVFDDDVFDVQSNDLKIDDFDTKSNDMDLKLNDMNEFEVRQNDYENINVGTLKICDQLDSKDIPKDTIEKDNGNIIKHKVETNLNVRELAIRFESPTEQKGPFTFEKFKAEIKYPTLERKSDQENSTEVKNDAPQSPKSYKLCKNTARSLDENAFIKEFGNEKDRRKSLEVKDGVKHTKYLPDLNLNPLKDSKESITPTSENKISIVQRPTDIKQLISFDTEKKLSRERIEKYKEERRNFLREKYSSQSFRSNPEQLTRIKIKKDDKCDEIGTKFERRNTVDLGQRMRFSLAKSANNLDTIQSPTSPTADKRTDAKDIDVESRDYDRKDKMSPSYNIRDMAAMFEQKTQGSSHNG